MSPAEVLMVQGNIQERQTDSISLGFVLPMVDVSPPGVALRTTWAGVEGATRAEVESALVEIGPAAVEQPLGELHVAALSSNTIYEVTIPAGKRVRSLTLQGFKTAEGADLVSSSNFPSGQRLVVSSKDGGTESPPLYSIPAVQPGGMLPAILTGASYSQHILKLPDLAAARIRLALVTGDSPASFARQPFQLASVSGTGVILSTDLELVDDKNIVLWSFPGEFPAQQPSASYDMSINLAGALNTALKANQPLDVTFRLRGKSPSQAGFRSSAAHGALVRDFPGVITTGLQGDPVAPDLGGSLASEQPHSVTADLTVTYEKIRILELPFSLTPAGTAPRGLVVTGQVVAWALPPQALGSLPLVKVGLVGRAAEDCELSVQIVDMSSGKPGDALGPPGVAKLSASNTLAMQWVDLPANLDLSQGGLGLAVRANTGRFLWLTVADVPQFKLAVSDPDPGGRPLRLSGTPILTVTQDSVHLPAQLLPAAAFRSSPPLLDSSLFLTVDMSDLSLRYAR